MVMRPSQPKDLEKLPMTWKKMGHLVPNNVEGHLHIQVPMAKIGHMVQNMRAEHEDNKKKWKNITFSTNSHKLCIDDCKKNSNGKWDCLIDSYNVIREECERYEDKVLVKMEHLQIQKLEHRNDVLKTNLVHKNQELEDERKKRFAVATLIFSILGITTGLVSLYNTIKVQSLNKKVSVLVQNDHLIASSLDTIFRHSTETNSNIMTLKNATHEMATFTEGQSTGLKLLQIQMERREHFHFNFQTSTDALDIATDIFNSMSNGKLSNRIGEIHDVDTAFENLVVKAESKHFTVTTETKRHLYR